MNLLPIWPLQLFFCICLPFPWLPSSIRLLPNSTASIVPWPGRARPSLLEQNLQQCLSLVTSASIVTCCIFCHGFSYKQIGRVDQHMWWFQKKNCGGFPTRWFTTSMINMCIFYIGRIITFLGARQNDFSRWFTASMINMCIFFLYRSIWEHAKNDFPGTTEAPIVIGRKIWYIYHFASCFANSNPASGLSVSQ